jgi:tricarballylate dehydrogenase
MDKLRTDVAIVGAGNAALSAALAATEAGAEVVVLEAAPEAERGGNSAFTAGAMRVTYDGVTDIRKLVPDLSEADIKGADFGSYSFDDYFDDMARITQHRADPDLLEILIRQSLPALQWMRGHGVRFQPSFGRQAYKVDGRFKFWGGLAVETWGGGPGLVAALFDGADRAGVRVIYEARARELMLDSGRVHGVRATLRGGETLEVEAGAVVLASGGFEANGEMRARYLGPGWDLAKVRGTRHNMGDGIQMALAVGAEPFGNWSGCHAVGWDMNAPPYGDLTVGDGFQKHSYPFGIMVNALGLRFLDEGADFRNFTYAKYGREILAQPGQFAWQIFDAKVTHLLRDEYRIRQVTRVSSDSIEDLAAKLTGVDAARLERTVAEFNAAVQTNVPFDPNVKDGRGTVGLEVPKSNWANPLDTPPFEAYGVTCGVTFTFGGLHIDDGARVLDVAADPIPGLYAAGELVGGLFYFNYPGGTGLTAGAVFGRLAGSAAAAHMKPT